MRLILGVFILTAAATAQPVVTAVVDGAAYTNNIAQGSVFVVKGSGLSASGIVQATTVPYPATLNDVSITITPVAGATVVMPRMVYTYNSGGVNQLAALLPSNAAVGAYDLKVTNGAATSAAFRITVVARKPGIVTANGDGSGPAQATLSGGLILARNSNVGKVGVFGTRSAHPGERVDLWGTGLGPDSASDTGGTSGDQTAQAQVVVLVDGIEVKPLYAGRSQGSPGLDQIVFNLPATGIGTALSCSVDIQVRMAGAQPNTTVLSNSVTLPTSMGDTCPVTNLRINEVESNGGTPGDWVEIYNPGPGAVDLAGWKFKDNDDTHAFYNLPVSTLAAGSYLVIEEADFGFGLGSPDSTRLFRPDGTLAASYSWGPHAATTYGRCPNGAGAFVTTNSSTKGGPNDCGSPIRINEVESDGGTPGDWVELFNPTDAAVDISGFSFRDNDDTHNYVFPVASSIPGKGFVVLEEAAFGFGLGSADSARLFDASSALVDSYTWTAHAMTTYGRCPDGSGAFTTTVASTKGAANSCSGAVTFSPWPGGSAIQVADGANIFGGNLSGLIYQPGDTAALNVLWGVRNGPGAIFRLVYDGTKWVADTANAWGSGKLLRYPDGTGDVDSEGITFTGDGPSAGIYVSSERNNSANTVSRNSVLRYNVNPSSATTLTAVNEWNLTTDLPVTGPNLGMEAITWIPDSFLTSKTFFDEAKNHAYNPAEYPNHGTGLFFIGLEANGMVYAYALNTNDNTFQKIATISTGLAGVMDLQFDRELNNLWAICDDTCQGRSVVLQIDTAGKFIVGKRFERPSGMPNLNNEGFAISNQSLCTGGTKPAFWADDNETDGHAIRSGTVTCMPF